ncbi:MAG: response regulator [Bacteroidales bacterium]|nr:response regulator [Bacteroidales bacterium]
MEINKEKSEIPQFEHDWTGKVILIAEDVETSNKFFNAALKRTNATLLWAKTGKEAVDIVLSSPQIDVILMDLNMPGLNGFEATRKIKEIRKTIPIIVQTAYLLSGEEKMSYEAGADEFISKPIKFAILLETLKKFI